MKANLVKVKKIESDRATPKLKKIVVKRYRIEKDGTKTLISSEPLKLGNYDKVVLLDRQVRRVTTPDGRTKKIITRRLQRPSTPTHQGLKDSFGPTEVMQSAR